MSYDVIVIGGGPAGYVAAIRSGQLGKKTLLVEKEILGGMCLNWGCIPTKALLESAKRLADVRGAPDFGVVGVDPSLVHFDWPKAASRALRVVKRLTKGVEYLLKKNQVEIEAGEATLNGPHEVLVNNRILTAEKIILATGSLPSLRSEWGLAPQAFFPFKSLLKEKALPQKPVIIGDGPSAIEMAQFFSMVGAEALMLTQNERLIAMADPFVSETAALLLKKSGVSFRPIEGVRIDTQKKQVEQGDWVFDYDALINLGDRQAVLPPMKGMSLKLDRGFIAIDPYLRSSHESVYAVGDCNGLSVFAHAASAQGLFAVNHIAGVPDLFPPKAVPLNLYTWPEIAQVGPGAHQLTSRGVEHKVAEFPLSANGKAMAEGQPDGTLRILYEPKYGEILGVTIVAPSATDMIAEAVALIELEGTVADVSRMVHAHPTVSEVMMEAAFVAVDAPIHR